MERSPESVLLIIREFVARQKGATETPIELDTPLLDEGIVDSFGLMDLAEEFGNAFEIQLLGKLLPEDFESPRTLWNRIQDVAS